MRNIIAGVLTATGCVGWIHTYLIWQELSEDEIIARFFTSAFFIVVAIALIAEIK